MRVKHETTYTYEHDIRYAIQRFYLTPRANKKVQVLNWEVRANFELSSQTDFFGNTMHLLVVNKPCRKISISVFGLIDISSHIDKSSKRGKSKFSFDEVSTILFKRPTHLTLANEEIQSVARRVYNKKTQQQSLLELAEVIEKRIVYSKGVTGVRTTAVDAWQRGAGVCQDHAHVMLAACRSQGLSARYVSGYLHGGTSASEATHAWVEVWIGKWLGIDVTHKKVVDNNFLSLAVGKDYLSVSPVRGVRNGGGEERMSVNVAVTG